MQWLRRRWADNRHSFQGDVDEPCWCLLHSSPEPGLFYFPNYTTRPTSLCSLFQSDSKSGLRIINTYTFRMNGLVDVQVYSQILSCKLGVVSHSPSEFSRIYFCGNNNLAIIYTGCSKILGPYSWKEKSHFFLPSMENFLLSVQTGKKGQFQNLYLNSSQHQLVKKQTNAG